VQGHSPRLGHGTSATSDQEPAASR